MEKSMQRIEVAGGGKALISLKKRHKKGTGSGRSTVVQKRQTGAREGLV